MFVLKMSKPPNVERKLLNKISRLKPSMNYPLRSQWKTNLDVFNIRWYITFYLLTAIGNLYNMKLRTSPSCDRFSYPHENLFHLLYECPSIQFFWQRVISWWNEKGSENVTLSALDILCGYKPESNIL